MAEKKPNKETKEAMKEASNPKKRSKAYHSTEDLMKALKEESKE